MAENKQIDDGGLAFPGKRNEVVNFWTDSDGNEMPASADVEYPGMSLRDWFAGQALVGFLSANKEIIWGQEHAAKWAYCYADAMIAARKAGA